MAVPDEVSCILQVVSEYLKKPCPITSLSGSQGPTHTEGLRHPQGDDGEGKGKRDAHQGSKVKHDAGTECCLSLCQAVSFLPAAEEDEEMMTRKEDGHGRGGSSHCREKTLGVLTVSDFECPLCIRSVCWRTCYNQ